MSERFVSRGFRGRRQERGVKGRLPPGQYVESGFPVLSRDRRLVLRLSGGISRSRERAIAQAMDVERVACFATRVRDQGHPLRQEMV